MLMFLNVHVVTHSLLTSNRLFWIYSIDQWPLNNFYLSSHVGVDKPTLCSMETARLVFIIVCVLQFVSIFYYLVF